MGAAIVTLMFMTYLVSSLFTLVQIHTQQYDKVALNYKSVMLLQTTEPIWLLGGINKASIHEMPNCSHHPLWLLLKAQ